MCSVFLSQSPVWGQYKKGFTLAELITVVVVLGIISSFTIPKILTAQNNTRFNSEAKSIASTLAEGIQNRVLLDNQTYLLGVGPAMKTYINYISDDSSSNYGVTNLYGSAWTCANANAAGQSCLIMPVGGCLQLIPPGWQWNGNSAVVGVYDPDCLGPTQRISFMVLNNGRIVSQGNNPYPIGHSDFDLADPSWFSWN